MDENIKDAEVSEKEVVNEVENKATQPKRQIIIETDGDTINIVKAEVSGAIEFVAIMQNLIGYISKNQPKQ